MLVLDFTPQQICVQLKLCTEIADKPLFYPISEEEDDAICKFTKTYLLPVELIVYFRPVTNEIPDNGVYVVASKADRNTSPNCLICEKVAKEIEGKIMNKHSREEIKKVLDHVCDAVDKKMKDKCVQFIAKHEEQIIDLIVKDVSVKVLCTALGFCFFRNNAEKFEEADSFIVPDCKFE